MQMKWSAALATAVLVSACSSSDSPVAPETAASPAGPRAVVYSPGTVTVQPTSTSNQFTEGWVGIGDRLAAVGVAAIGAQPATQTLGTGSLRMTNSAFGWEVMAPTAPAVPAASPLSAITALSYDTYAASGQAGITVQAVALQFTIDYDLTDAYDGFQGRLVYEPYNCGGVVAYDTWQRWTPLTQGCWWSSANPAGTSAPYVGGVAQTGALACPQSAPCSWSAVKVAYPDAGFHRTNAARGVIFKVGSTWFGTFYTDRLVVGVNGVTTTYDFEPATACTTTCYVNAATGDDAFGGDTPGTAKRTIQGGVNQVAANGTVIVAAGSYPEQVSIAKDNLTIQGAGAANTILQGSTCTGTGIDITGSRTGIAVKGVTITGYNWGIRIAPAGGSATDMAFTDMSVSGNCIHGIWGQSFASTNLTFTNVNASNNNAGGGSSGRGLWLINGVKTNITVTGGNYSGNGLVGIDLSDGTATGVSITGASVSGNGDAGIGVLGAGGSMANLIANNSVTNNGRYGIEIKMPEGTGLATGAGSVVVSGNTVSRTVAATDLRDYAGIVVMRRGSLVLPTGAVVTGNTVSGYTRAPIGSTGDGFGIVVEGTNHTVSKNVVSGNDVGVQIQAGNSPNDQGTPYFDRGDAPTSSAVINRNSITGNTVALRNVGAPLTDAKCNWYGSASGPAAGAVVGSFTTSPFLQSSNLNAGCPADNDAPVVTNVSVTPNPAPVTTATYTLTANASDNVGVQSASYTIDGGAAVPFSFTPGTPVSLSATFGPKTVGVYTICVTATDANGNTSTSVCTALAVFDPTGGFVTGGGRVNSPAGADKSPGNNTLSGPAQFAFVSKYLKGKTTPDGNMQFRFDAGDLQFRSTDMEWLVVSGNKAQFRGVGTLGDGTVCSYTVTSSDNGFTSAKLDSFGIRINCGGGDRYVLDESALTQGSVQIQSK